MFIDTNNNTQSYHRQHANVFDSKNTRSYDSRMGNLKENLDRKMKEKGWNAYDLEDECEKKGQKVPQPTIQRILSGKHKDPRPSTVKKIAIGLGISEIELWGWEDKNHIKEEFDEYKNITPISNIEPGPDIKGKIPLINYVQAGKWCEIMEIDEPVEWIERTVDVSEKAFALRVVGDSMTNPFGVPSIPEGFIVIVDPAIQASSGSIVVARLENSNEAVLKQLIIDGPNTYLKSLNPDYRPIFINDNCTICGVVKKVQFEL